MLQEERYDAFPNDRLQEGEEPLPTISLVHIPHAKIPNLFQCCYEYVDPWEWSAAAELVETGRWFFGPIKDEV